MSKHLGATIPLKIGFFDEDGVPQVALSVAVAIQRDSDQAFWTGVGWQTPISWFSASNWGYGIYKYSLNTALAGFGSPSSLTIIWADTTTRRVVGSLNFNLDEDYYASQQTGGVGTNVTAIKAVTDQLATRIPNDNLMGSSVKTSKDDEIDSIKAKTDLLPVSPANEATSALIKTKTDLLPASPANEVSVQAVKIKTDNLPLDPTSEAVAVINRDIIKDRLSVIDGIIVVDGLNTPSTFKTNLPSAINDFYVDQVVLFRTGAHAGISRRVSSYNGSTKFITVTPALTSIPAGSDAFSIIGRPAPAGVSMTEATIADAVCDEIIAAHSVGGSVGATLQRVPVIESKVDAETVIDNAIKAKTDKLNFNAEATPEILAETKRLDTQAKADVNQQADIALADYDPPTRTEATSDKNEIIVEVNANEAKIDAVQTTSNLIKAKTDPLPSDPADESQIEAAIISARNILQGEHATIIAKEDSLLAAVLSIQNNTTTVIVVPQIMEKPESPGTKTYRIVLMNYDGVGGMEDFFQSAPGVYECQVKVDEIDGTPILPYAYLVRDSQGVYHIDFEVDYTDLNRPILFTFQLENLLTVIRYATRTSEITDEGTLLERIKSDTGEILIDTGTTLPAQIHSEISVAESDINANIDNTRNILKSEIDENQAILEALEAEIITSISIPNNIVIPLGTTKTSVAVGMYETEIPVENLDVLSEFGVVECGGLQAYHGKNTLTNKLTGVFRKWDPNGQPTLPGPIPLGTPCRQATVSNFIASYRNAKNEVLSPSVEPLLTILNDLDDVILSTFMLWDDVLKAWRWSIAFDSSMDYKEFRWNITTQFGTKVIKDSGSIRTEYSPGVLELVPGFAGGAMMNGEFLFDQDGYIDNDSIVHPWPDEYAGYVRDPTTGDRLQDVVIRAFRVLEDGSIVRDAHPPYENITDILGNFRGALDRGTFMFEFTRDGHVFFSVERTIDP